MHQFYIFYGFLRCGHISPRLKLGIEFVLDDGAGISSGGNNLHHIHRLSPGIHIVFQRFSSGMCLYNRDIIF